MGENTKIQWTRYTFNHVRGCTKVAPGCANCYAESQSKRNPGTLGAWGPNGTRVLASEAMWRKPVTWNRDAARLFEAHGERVSELDNDGVSRCSWPALTQFQHNNGDADDECEVLLEDSKGGDMAEWPEYLRVRELPR